MRERWRNIRRAPAGYRVSSYGRVRSPGALLSPAADEDGYLRVTLAGEKVQVTHLVLEAFVSPRPFGSEACHDPIRSEGRQDCRLAVLRWGTHRENEQDKKKARRAGMAEGTRRVLRQTWPETAKTKYVTLAQAVDLGVVSCSLVAVRKASQRPGFPEPAGIRGTAHVWQRDALDKWDAG